MGHTVSAIHVDEFFYRGIFKKNHHHLNIGPGIVRLNKNKVR